MNARTENEKLSNHFGVEVTNFARYSDGFGFTVPSELDAYKIAYKYQPSKTVVKPALIDLWLIQVYTPEDQEDAN